MNRGVVTGGSSVEQLVEVVGDLGSGGPECPDDGDGVLAVDAEDLRSVRDIVAAGRETAALLDRDADIDGGPLYRGERAGHPDEGRGEVVEPASDHRTGVARRVGRHEH